MIIPCVCSFSTFFAFVLQTPCSSVNRQYSRTAGLLQRRPRVGGGLASPSARHARRHRSGHQGGAAPLARYFGLRGGENSKRKRGMFGRYIAVMEIGYYTSGGKVECPPNVRQTFHLFPPLGLASVPLSSIVDHLIINHKKLTRIFVLLPDKRPLLITLSGRPLQQLEAC